MDLEITHNGVNLTVNIDYDGEINAYNSIEVGGVDISALLDDLDCYWTHLDESVYKAIRSKQC